MSGVRVKWTRLNVLRCMQTYTLVVMGESGDYTRTKNKTVRRTAADSPIATKNICVICKSIISNYAPICELH